MKASTFALVLACGLALGSCTFWPLPPDTDADAAGSESPQERLRERHLVLFAAGSGAPDGLADRVASLGGSLDLVVQEVGMAAVSGLGEAAAAELSSLHGVQSVEPDPSVSLAVESGASDEAPAPVAARDAAGEQTALATAPVFYARQWNLLAVSAEKAWKAGHVGSKDVVVAILDTGIDYLHPELAGLVDLRRSRSLLWGQQAIDEKAAIEDVEDSFPAGDPHRHLLPIADLHYHGTAAASIVASNANFLAGVTRNTTLLAVKVADRTSQSTAATLIAGIVYAANQGADVISISRGHDIDRRTNPGTALAYELAALYALHKGALIAGISFNDAADLDNNGDIVRYPCEAMGVICASATAPLTSPAAPEGPWDGYDLDARAARTPMIPGPYSGFGAAVDVAAPGGGGVGVPLLHTKVWVPCTTTPTSSTPGTGPNSCNDTSTPIERRLGRGVGTSWAAPHVAGLAALLVAQLGHGNPLLIRSRILETADDKGEPGRDPYYGYGRINVAKALGVE
jgi:subtilisin family serine protease